MMKNISRILDSIINDAIFGHSVATVSTGSEEKRDKNDNNVANHVISPALDAKKV